MRRCSSSGAAGIVKGDARTLAPRAPAGRSTTDAGPLRRARRRHRARRLVERARAQQLGLTLPFFVKRGYHMHYEAEGRAGAQPAGARSRKGLCGRCRWSSACGSRRARNSRALDDPPSSAHIDRLEPFAREMFPIGARKEAEPWLGRRPCLPDMRPIIGPFPGKPGLWLDFGHQHLGLTLGPISGRLLAEMMAGERPSSIPRRSGRRGSGSGLYLLQPRATPAVCAMSAHATHPPNCKRSHLRVPWCSLWYWLLVDQVTPASAMVGR